MQAEASTGHVFPLPWGRHHPPHELFGTVPTIQRAQVRADLELCSLGTGVWMWPNGPPPQATPGPPSTCPISSALPPSWLAKERLT